MTAHVSGVKVAAPLPPLPEPLVLVRDTDDEPEGGGWIVDCDCEGPLSYSLEANQALYTAEQMEAYARAALASGVDSSAETRMAFCPACFVEVTSDQAGEQIRAACVLAEFAKTAPGRLPSRVQEALAVIDGVGVFDGRTAGTGGTDVG